MDKAASAKLHHLRREYHSRPFDEASVPKSPVELFQLWFEDALASEMLEPNAMSLATADQGGRVSCRTVLLKAYDEAGFVFFTNYQSAKAQQIAENPHVALLFPWLMLSRQIEITGVAEKISIAESLEYFVKRPLKSRIGAWVSAQSSVISSRQILESKFEEMCRKFANGQVPLPAAWGGYRIVPSTIEFWQGGAYRLHDRIHYSRVGDSWSISRLAP